MNIGIIVHSRTGTTLEFSKMISEKLMNNGNSVDIIDVQTDKPVDFGSVRQTAKFSVTNVPDCTKYDSLLIGGPVWAFSASPVIIECLNNIDDMSGKKVLPFVTMGFPMNSMGGSQAIKLMSSIASDKGAQVLPGKIVPKMFRRQKRLMEEAATEIQSYFAQK